MSKRNRVFLITLFLLLVLLISLSASIPAEFPICTHPTYQEEPSVSGNIVVWEEGRNFDYTGFDIYGYDLSTDMEFSICTAASHQESPAVSGNIVVWQDKRNVNSDIYGYDISTDTEFPICTHPSNQEAPSVSGNIVVWEDSRNYGDTSSDIYGYNLSTDMEFAICTASSGQHRPRISGNIVVWYDNRNGSNRDIYGYDLSMGVEFPICTHTSFQSSPSVFGNIVVWHDDRNGNYDIYGYDISTDTEFPICLDAMNQNEPSVSGNYVAWRDFRGAMGHIYVYNLSTNTEFPIYTSPSTRPRISDDTVVWETSNDIYGCYLNNLGDLDHITLSPDGYSVDAGATVDFSVEAFDPYNNSLGDVTASSDLSIDTGAGGSWSGGTYTSEIAGTWTVTATKDGKTDTATLTVNTGDAYEITLDVDSHCVLADGISVVNLSATLKDEFGNKLPDGTIVGFSTSEGTIGNVTTTTNGVATATLTSTDHVATALVEATYDALKDHAYVYFTNTCVGINDITESNIDVCGNIDLIQGCGTYCCVQGSALVIVAEYNGNPNDSSILFQLGEYIDLFVPDIDTLTSIEIRLYYDDSNVVGINEGLLQLYWLSDHTWTPCSNTGVDVRNNYVWAIIDSTTYPSLDDLLGTAFTGGSHYSSSKYPNISPLCKRNLKIVNDKMNLVLLLLDSYPNSDIEKELVELQILASELELTANYVYTNFVLLRMIETLDEIILILE